MSTSAGVEFQLLSVCDSEGIQEVICISSDEEKEVRKRNDIFVPVPSPSLNCSICKNEMIAASKVHEHPFLRGVGVCSECYDGVCNAEFTKRNGHEKQCRWCGDGGTIVMCENCEKVFCKDCIVRNFGHKEGWLPILEDDDWICFCCDSTPLQGLVKELESFRKAMAGHSCYFLFLRTPQFHPQAKIKAIWNRATSPTNNNNVNCTDESNQREMHKVKRSNKRPVQEAKKSGKRSVQYKSSKQPSKREDLCEMKEAFKEMEDAIKLHDAGEHASAVKKFKKAIEYLDADTQYFDDLKKQANRAKIGCYSRILSCMKELD